MESTLCVPRSTTWEALRRSRNEAAILTLKAGIQGPDSNHRHQCLRALAGRQEKSARQTIILYWENLVERDLEFLRQQPELFLDSCEEMLQLGSMSDKRAAIATIAGLDLIELLDRLLQIVVDQRHALSSQATHCLLDMCERWGRAARDGQDMSSRRTRMLEKLYNQIVLYHEHKNPKVVDAWLRLAHWDDSTQRGLISDSRLDANREIIKRLEQSEEPAILELLAGYLGRKTTPKRILDILVNRTEPALAMHIAGLQSKTTLPQSIKHLKQLSPLKCLNDIESKLDQSNFEQDKRLWLLISASSDDNGLVLRGALKMSRHGTSEARMVAAEMLRNCRNTSLDTLVPALQSASIAAHEEDGLGNLVFEIAAWLDSPSVPLQKAATNFLKDFTLENLFEQVRHWPTQMCKAMAQVVRIVETDVSVPLSRMLQSPAPKRRMAALQVTQLLECADSVKDTLMPLLNDDRLEVRVRVIDLLSDLGYEPLEEEIPNLLNDASTDIQDAANRALRRFHRRQASANSPETTSAGGSQ